MTPRLSDRTRQYVGVAIGIALVLAGTLATGVLPSTTPYQVIAGAIIVAGFVVGYASLGTFGFRE
ncbi:hypothetical protein ACKVMT_04300 [Halobacteriales archaeon Cl-PHB]